MPIRLRRALPRAAAALAVALLTVALASPAPALASPRPGVVVPSPELASNGYVETETTTYTVNPAKGRIDVTIDIDFKNTKRPSASTIYFFSEINVWLEHAATHVSVRVDANPAAVILRDKREGFFDRYLVRWGKALLYGQTRHILVRYQLPSGAPRSASDIRIGQAIASFCVVGQGDDGGTTKVVIPSSFDAEIVGGDGGDLHETATSGQGSAALTTFTTGKLDTPWEFWACLNATNADGYAAKLFSSPSGRSIRIEAWPEDPEWNADVQSQIDGILVKLETLVGRGLPEKDEQIVIREVAGSELAGYAGFYNPLTGVISIGEDLAQGDTLAHELAHAWFNNFEFFDTWMSEGLAEWGRISTVPDTCPKPRAYPVTGSPDIDQWIYVGPRSSDEEFELVDYQYEAACYVVATLAARSGPAGTRAAIQALLDNELAYRSGDTVLTRPHGKATWREFLDAFDELGLVPAGEDDLDFAQKLLADYGIAADDATARLADRSKARAAYHGLVAELGDWTMPEVILRPMSTWSFVSAQAAIEQAAAIQASLAQADATLPGIGARNGPVRGMFEEATSADELGAAVSLAADQAAAADAVAAATARAAAPRDTFSELGLAGAELGSPLAAATAAAKGADLAGALASVATVNALLDGASQQGLLRVAMGIGIVVLLLLVVAFGLLRRRRRHMTAALASAMAGGSTADLLGGETAPSSGDLPRMDLAPPGAASGAGAGPHGGAESGAEAGAASGAGAGPHGGAEGREAGAEDGREPDDMSP